MANKMNKCKVCNGTHVYHGEGKGFVAFMTCYECGPRPVEQFAKELAEFETRLVAAKKEMEVVV